ncbi:myosin light chain kinase 3 isoform X2 [Pseudophryne corroboree]|uniref:myosin light chain kinase 3 isoform X2 n=1 Tax=Pseudophryne corroboree TaxID=495146 RepID=UPI00308199B6
MSKQDSLTSCLAKMYESKFDNAAGPGKSPTKSPGGLNGLDKKLNVLNEKMDKLLHIQEDVIGKLALVHHGMGTLERGMDKLSALHGPNPGDVEGCDPRGDGQQVSGPGAFHEFVNLLKILHKDSLIQQEKLDSLERVVSTVDKVVAFVGKTLRNSKIVDFILKGTVPWRREAQEEAKDNSEEKETKQKHAFTSRDSQAEIQRAASATHRSKSQEEKRISQKTAPCGSPHSKANCTGGQSPLETSQHLSSPDSSKPWTQKVAGERPEEKSTQTDPQHIQPSHNPSTEQDTRPPEEPKEILGEPGGDRSYVTRNPASISPPGAEDQPPREGAGAPAGKVQVSSPVAGNAPVQHKIGPEPVCQRVDVMGKDKQASSATKAEELQTVGGQVSIPQQKTGGTDVERGDLRGDDEETDCGKKGAAKHQKGEVIEKDCDRSQAPGQSFTSDLPSGSTELLEASSLHIIDDCPPPPAPFNHRIVSIKQAILSSCYKVCQHEVLGGGRFGQVHKCIEITSGLRLAAKIIKVKGPKDREEVKNEINVMNQLNHVNLIQLYDAFECKNDLTLIMEYLDGGELFDRITDDDYNLTELDAIMFTKQICEGIYYLHQQYILHLDLKPENILCVSRTGNQIKIIDFGLARRYKPREKLKVNFGTPEFLAPEVVNYDFVSFPTDMWSVGVITYMLLSGLSPFLGESDAETMNYIVNCNWDFDSETFAQVSEEAKDFISRLLVKEKSGRLSAGQCLKHEWLVNMPLKAKKHKVRLKSQILLQKYMAQKKWKKYFYIVTAANRLRKFQMLSLKPS